MWLMKAYRLNTEKVKYKRLVKKPSGVVVQAPVTAKRKAEQHTVTFVQHAKSVQVIIQNPSIKPGKPCLTQSRGKIKEYSFPAKARMRMALEDTIDLWKVYAVLSYPAEFPWDGRICAKHRNTLLTWLRNNGIKEYFWGLEFQERGAPHINLLLPCFVDLGAISAEWFKIVGSGDLNHLKAGVEIQAIRKKDEIVTYLLGYTMKDDQKEVPGGFENVGRFWGCHRYEKRVSTFTKRFESQEAMNEFLEPVIGEYETMLKGWHDQREKKLGKPCKPYKWRFKGRSWVMWSGNDFIDKFIENGGCKDVERI